MESPVKMQPLAAESNKENLDAKYLSDEVAVPIKGIPDLPEIAKKNLELAERKEQEADEPLLAENAQRFVLFPIKYHEVSVIVALDTRLHA